MNAHAIEGRVALVTGASTGIGRATALLLAEQGARVMAVARSAAGLASLSAEADIAHVALSLLEPDAVSQVIDATHRQLGPISILVNNAGAGGWGEAPIWDQPLDTWNATMRLNLEVPFLLTRAASADMRQLGWGRIVMVSSTAGQVGAPQMSAYCASKHGLIGLARSVAHDVGTFGGTCNAVLPGWVRTPMAEADAVADADRLGITVDEVWAQRDAAYPRGRVVEPEEIARIIAWLASDAASAVNGEALTAALGGLW